MHAEVEVLRQGGVGAAEALEIGPQQAELVVALAQVGHLKVAAQYLGGRLGPTGRNERAGPSEPDSGQAGRVRVGVVVDGESPGRRTGRPQGRGVLQALLGV